MASQTLNCYRQRRVLNWGRFENRETLVIAMKVLFVCNANVSRSQVAEALYAKLSGCPAESAGTRADEVLARTSPPSRMLKETPSRAMAYMKAEYVDISEKLRTQLTAEMVEEADKVVVMADVDSWPPYLRNNPKVVHWELTDPIGLDEEAARKIFDEIKLRVTDLVRQSAQGS